MAKGIKTGGRVKGSPNKATLQIKELARVHAEEAIRTLAELLTTAESEQARIAAAKELLDRGFGRPMQAVEVSGPDGGAIEVDSTLTPSEAYQRLLNG